MGQKIRNIGFVSRSSLFLFLLWLASSSARGQDAAEKEAMGKAAVTAYAANIESFPFYKCRYRHTKAQAHSIQDAIRGEYFNASSYDLRLLIDDERDLQEGFAPPPNPKQARPMPGGGFMVTSPGCSDHYLGDGKREMNYYPPLRSINLFSKESNVRSIELTPLGMFYLGHRNRHGPNIRLNQPEKFAFSTNGFEEVDGRPVITVRFRNKKIMQSESEPPLEFTYTYSFDPARGHLPIRMQMLWNGKPKTQVFVTQVRECSKQRWFPERSIEVVTPDKEGDLYDVSEIKLLELDADHRPDKSEFFFVVPAGTSVQNTAKLDGRHFFKLKQEEKITIDDIPKLFEMCEKAATVPLMDTAMPNSSTTAWIRWSLGLGGLILAVVGMSFFVRRSRLRRVAT